MTLSSIVTSPCSICGREIRDGDVLSRIESGDVRGWAHIACTKPGVLRWIDEGRPHDDPLDWDRRERPTWRAEPGDGARAWWELHDRPEYEPRISSHPSL